MSDPRDTETKILQFLERFKVVPGAYDKLRGHLENMMAEKLRQDAFSSFGTLPLTTLVEYMETLNGIARKTAQSSTSSTDITTQHVYGPSCCEPVTLKTTLFDLSKLSDDIGTLQYIAPAVEPATVGGEGAVPEPPKPKRHIKNARSHKPNSGQVAKRR